MSLVLLQTDSNQRKREKEIPGKDGEGSPRNMYTGHMDKDNGGEGEDQVWEVGVGRAGGVMGENGDNCN